MLREIRNDDSHRCSVMDISRSKILEDYERIQAKHTKGIKKNQIERMELNYKTLNFLEEKNYKKVRKDLMNLANNIKKYFA